MLASVLDAAVHDITVESTRGARPEVHLRLYVPEGLKTVRGILLVGNAAHGDGRDRADRPAYRALADDTGFALVATAYLDRYMRSAVEIGTNFNAWAPPGGGGDGRRLREGLAQLAAASGHPELTHAPVVFWGFSGGGQMAYEFNAWQPERTIAFAANKGGFYTTEVASAAARRTPAVLIAGERDTAARRQRLAEVFADNEAAGTHWTLLVEREKAHAEGAVDDILLPFFRAAIALRCPPAGAGPAGLRDVSPADGRRLLADVLAHAGASGFSAPLATPAAERARHREVHHVIRRDQEFVDGRKLGVQPGQVVGLEAGARGRLVLVNFHGEPGKPVIIVNHGGKVTIAGDGPDPAVRIGRSSHFEFRGDGDTLFPYGIEVTRAGSHGLEVTDLSTDYELCHLLVSLAGYAGIMAKTDPRCDLTANRGHFTQRNVRIHHNHIHDVGGEGMYVGSSFYTGTKAAGCGEIFPHDLTGLRIHDNLIERAGREGLQVGCATADCEIRRNTILDPGRRRLEHQDSGLQLSPGTTGRLEGNLVANAPGNGIVLLGLGDNLVGNNVVVNAGGHGIFCDNRNNASDPAIGTRAGSFVRILNNTIVNPRQFAFRTFNELSRHEFRNNLVVLPVDAGGLVDAPGTDLTSAHNLVQATTEGLGFVNPGAQDYRIRAESVVAGAGEDLAALGVTADAAGRPRPAGAAFAAGAFEPLPARVSR